MTIDKVCPVDKKLITVAPTESSLITSKPCLLYHISARNFLIVNIYKVVGSLFPNAAHFYVPGAMVGGKQAYASDDGIYDLYWNLSELCWEISPDFFSVNYLWRRYDSNIEGDYQPFLSATGVATISFEDIGRVICVYDGFNRSGVLKLRLMGANEGLKSTFFNISFKYPIFLSKGFYLYMSWMSLNCLVTYKLID